MLLFFFSLSHSQSFFFFSFGRGEKKTDSSGCFFPVNFFTFCFFACNHLFFSFFFTFYFLFLFRLENKKQKMNFMKITKTIYMHHYYILRLKWLSSYRNTMSSGYNYGRLALNLTSNPYVCWRRLTDATIPFQDHFGGLFFLCYHKNGNSENIPSE